MLSNCVIMITLIDEAWIGSRVGPLALYYATEAAHHSEMLVSRHPFSSLIIDPGDGACSPKNSRHRLKRDASMNRRPQEPRRFAVLFGDAGAPFEESPEANLCSDSPILHDDVR